MLLRNYSKKISYNHLLLLLIILAGCTWYKTIQVSEPITAEKVGATHEFKKVVIIHDLSEKKEYVLENLSIENDSLKGEISAAPLGRKHKPQDKSFLKSTVKAYPPLSTMHIFTLLNDISPGEISIPVSAVKNIEIHDKNIVKSVVMSTLLIVPNALVVVGIIAAGAAGGGVDFSGMEGTWCTSGSCPNVSSNNENETQNHGVLFPGSIFKSLERHDYLILENSLLNDQGDLNLIVSNDPGEIEYIDQLELLEVNHDSYKNLGLSNENEFVAYNEPNSPILSSSEISDDIKKAIEYEDSLSFNFDNPESTDDLNEITLKFERSDFSENAQLIINGKKSLWSGVVNSYIFLNMGNDYDDWVNQKDKSSAEKWWKKNIQQGVALNVYMKINDSWEHVGSHHDVGTFDMRNLALDLNLKSVNSQYIEIKLESAYKIWEINYVGLTNDWTTDLTINTIDFESAFDQNGNDVFPAIQSTDEIYHVQDTSSTYIDLHVKNLAPKSNSKLILHGSGYYHYIQEYDHECENKFFVQLNDKLAIQDVSRALDMYQSFFAATPTD